MPAPTALTTLNIVAPVPPNSSTAQVNPVTAKDGAAGGRECVFVDFVTASGPGVMGQIVLRNDGPDVVFGMFNVPGAPGSFANFPASAISAASIDGGGNYIPGVFSLALHEVLALSNVVINSIGLIAEAGVLKTATVMIISVQNSGSTGSAVG